ncbi:hypothetical protein ACSXAY_11595 [Clostridium perfringens]
MIYLVTYDLNKSGQNYSKLYDTLKSFPSWCHCTDSTWLIESHSDSKTIHEKLKSSLDSNDSILIIRVSKDYCGVLPRKTCDWLKSNIN